MTKAGNKLDQLKQLWQVSFKDTPEYTNFFFSRAYNGDKTVTRELDGKIVSATQFRYFDIINGLKTYKGVYIYGVCTDPDFRRRGLSTEIINQIIMEQAKSGMDIAFLIPSDDHLFEFYARLMFVPVFTVWEEQVSIDTIETVKFQQGYSIITPSGHKLYEFYNNFYMSLPKAALKDPDYFMFAIEDVIAGGGRIDVCGSDGEIRGFAASYGNTVKELLYLDNIARNTILSLLLTENAGETLKVYTQGHGPAPSPEAVNKPIGMARIINPALSEKDLYGSYANLLLN